MYRRSIAALGIYFLLVAATQAEPSSTCSEEKTENDMYECLKLKLAESDSELNARYKKLMTLYKGFGKQTLGDVESQDVYLKKAQIAWIAFRDANCNYETYDYIASRAFGSIYTDCLLTETKNRVEYLKADH